MVIHQPFTDLSARAPRIGQHADIASHRLGYCGGQDHTHNQRQMRPSGLPVSSFCICGLMAAKFSNGVSIGPGATRHWSAPLEALHLDVVLGWGGKHDFDRL